MKNACDLIFVFMSTGRLVGDLLIHWPRNNFMADLQTTIVLVCKCEAKVYEAHCTKRKKEIMHRTLCMFLYN